MYVSFHTADIQVWFKFCIDQECLSKWTFGTIINVFTKQPTCLQVKAWERMIPCLSSLSGETFLQIYASLGLMDYNQAASTVTVQDKFTSGATVTTCTDAPHFKLSATTKLCCSMSVWQLTIYRITFYYILYFQPFCMFSSGLYLIKMLYINTV